jgi:hypothetical protein
MDFPAPVHMGYLFPSGPSSVAPPRRSLRPAPRFPTGPLP